jgi:3-oxoacyl-[acyl-carrier protein] reductase
MNLDLAGKVAIVTGSSKGLGLASARALAQEGCRVTICARGETSLNEAAAELRTVAQRPADVLPVVADVSTAAGVETVVARTVEVFGGLDILVNNVGLAKGSDIVGTSDECCRRPSDSRCLRAVARGARAVRGCGSAGAAPRGW